MNLNVTGMPAIIIQVGFIVVFSAPVWLGARMVGAQHPTIIRSALSLFVGAIASAVCIVWGGGFAWLLAPLAFLFSFKFILGTSFIGSIGLAIIALAAYVAMIHFIGGAFTVSGTGAGTSI